MRIALGVQYVGTRYHGWQRQLQPELPTIQQQLEMALQKVAPADSIEVICAGRTDAGVHATGQVIHFNTEIERPERAWILGSNAHLPHDIAVQWARIYDHKTDFHARYTALARHYRYLVYNDRTRSAIWHNRATPYYLKLDIERMQTAANVLLGEQDFNAFRSSQCQSKSSYRNMHFIRITEQKPLIFIDLQANAFLHHMVRNIVGVLLEIGSGKRDITSMKTILASKDRTQAAVTASADGLYLTQVLYPEQFQIPSDVSTWHANFVN